MKTLLSLPVLASLVLLLAPTAARAGELDPAHLPADAKWVLHLDFESLSETDLIQRVRENRPELVAMVRHWMQNRYGIDPREDLKGITAFSETYASHTGTLILKASYDIEKVKSDLQNKPNVTTTEWQDQTLYTVHVRMHRPADDQQDDEDRDRLLRRDRQLLDRDRELLDRDRPERDRPDRDRLERLRRDRDRGEDEVVEENQADQDRDDRGRADREPGDRQRLRERLSRRDAADQPADQPRDDDRDGDRRQGPTVTLVLLDDETMVAASSAQRAKDAVKLLNGDSPSMKDQQSELTAKAPAGAFLYGAAIDLQQIDEHGGVFPVLRQHERIMWAVGQEGDQVYEEATLVAASPEVAEQMETVMQGLVAFQKVWAGDSQALRRLADQAEVSRDGNTVRVEGRSDKQTVLEGLRDVADRIQQRRQSARR